VGGRRRLGGKWLSIADEERIDALLVDCAHDDADEDDDWCPFGEGYKPAQEIAERLAAIEQQLDELTSVRSLSGDYNLQPEPLAPPVAHGDLGTRRWPPWPPMATDGYRWPPMATDGHRCAKEAGGALMTCLTALRMPT